MVDEIGKKRSMIVPGSDEGRLRELDDIPLSDGDAKSRIKVTEQSPTPLTVESMARYLRELTTTPAGARGNAYPIKESFATVRSHEPDGTPTAIVTPSDDAANVFASDSDREVVMALAGQMFDSDTIRKLRDPQTGFHEVLRTFVPSTGGRNPEVATPSAAPDVQKKVSGILKRNRFNPDPGNTPYLPLASAASTIDQRPIGRGQSELGKYTLDTANVTYEQMKKLGLALMLRSTGEFIGHDGDPTDTGNSIAALIPGSAQLLGSKIIDRKSLWAGDLTPDQGAPPGIGIRDKASSLDLTLDNGTHSYGSLNTHLEPFDGFAPVGMLTLGAALIVALKLLSEGFELIFAAISPPPIPPSSDAVSPTPEGAVMTPGTSRYGPITTTESVTGFFGFTTTKHNYSNAFDRGVDIFFGFDGISDIVNGAKRLLESPGYYVVMIREIIRSGAKIVESIVDAFKSGPVGAVQGLLGLVDVIRSSKIVGYFNMVTRLGDVVLTMEDEGLISVDAVGELADPGNLPNNGKFSTIDNIILNAATRISKNRVDDNDVTLAWATSATPSAYLLPATIMNAADYMPSESDFGLTSLTDTIESLRKKSITDASETRLSSDVVKTVEDELDSEYVPFYFHDLRTNEIVSFHAFLAACNDSFSVSYDSANYYGRVDPVRIYNHTERTINLTFNIVSTNPNDFDVMWWKINKLVTMLYPQWSKGRKLVVTPGQDEFIQPFSQVPTSSPVIRLRLGDIFKSNYSKFSLARLFGLGSADLTIKGKQQDPSRVKKLIDLNEKMTALKAKIKQKPATKHDAEDKKFGYQVGFRAFFRPTDKFVLDPASGFVGPPLPGSKDKEPIKAANGKIAVTVRKINSKQMGNKLEDVTYSVELDQVHVPPGFSTGPYQANFSQLQPDDKDIRKQVIDAGAQDPGTISDTNLDDVKNFFLADNNAIVRSFESAAGRGLAGVITSMAFDWKAPTWDTTAIGHRAPQWCQVTLTFLPIHDIAPGLDSNGFNRAPVYNVGETVRHVTSDVYNDGNNEKKFEQNHAAGMKNRKKG